MQISMESIDSKALRSTEQNKYKLGLWHYTLYMIICGDIINLVNKGFACTVWRLGDSSRMRYIETSTEAWLT